MPPRRAASRAAVSTSRRRRPGRGFAPEWAWSYEAGLKTSLASGRGQLNLAAFRTDYTDLQVQTSIRPGVLDISNAAGPPSAESSWKRPVHRPAAPAWGTRGLARRQLRPLRRAWRRRGDGDVAGSRRTTLPSGRGASGSSGARARAELGTFSLRAASRWQSTVFFTPFNDAVQRQSAVWSAGAERGAWAAALDGLGRRAQPDGRGLHHRQPRLAAAGVRRPPAQPREWGVRLAVWSATNSLTCRTSRRRRRRGARVRYRLHSAGRLVVTVGASGMDLSGYALAILIRTQSSCCGEASLWRARHRIRLRSSYRCRRRASGARLHPDAGTRVAMRAELDSSWAVGPLALGSIKAAPR